MVAGSVCDLRGIARFFDFQIGNFARILLNKHPFWQLRTQAPEVFGPKRVIVRRKPQPLRGGCGKIGPGKITPGKTTSGTFTPGKTQSIETQSLEDSAKRRAASIVSPAGRPINQARSATGGRRAAQHETKF